MCLLLLHFSLVLDVFGEDEIHHFYVVVHYFETVYGRWISRDISILVKSSLSVFVHRAHAIDINPEIKLYIMVYF